MVTYWSSTTTTTATTTIAPIHRRWQLCVELNIYAKKQCDDDTETDKSWTKSTHNDDDDMDEAIKYNWLSIRLPIGRMSRNGKRQNEEKERKKIYFSLCQMKCETIESWLPRCNAIAMVPLFKLAPSLVVETRDVCTVYIQLKWAGTDDISTCLMGHRWRALFAAYTHSINSKP